MDPRGLKRGRYERFAAHKCPNFNSTFEVGHTSLWQRALRSEWRRLFMAKFNCALHLLRVPHLRHSKGETRKLVEEAVQ